MFNKLFFSILFTLLTVFPTFGQDSQSARQAFQQTPGVLMVPPSSIQTKALQPEKAATSQMFGSLYVVGQNPALPGDQIKIYFLVEEDAPGNVWVYGQRWTPVYDNNGQPAKLVSYFSVQPGTRSDDTAPLKKGDRILVWSGEVPPESNYGRYDFSLILLDESNYLLQQAFTYFSVGEIESGDTFQARTGMDPHVNMEGWLVLEQSYSPVTIKLVKQGWTDQAVEKGLGNKDTTVFPLNFCSTEGSPQRAFDVIVAVPADRAFFTISRPCTWPRR